MIVMINTDRLKLDFKIISQFNYLYFTEDLFLNTEIASFQKNRAFRKKIDQEEETKRVLGKEQTGAVNVGGQDLLNQ